MKPKKKAVRTPKAETDSRSFYGAGKSKNEIYFQMASVFRAVSRDENRLAGIWMSRIMAGGNADISGNGVLNVI
ncbi:MAG: hypothetical protein MI747_25365 [Desulfobacterales bacterium]|nr:hypothetical protein [Desulfobacterales bacterium]